MLCKFLLYSKVTQLYIDMYILFQTLNFLFCIGYSLNNGVVVSGEQWRDSAVHVHVSILPQTLPPPTLAHNFE